MAATKAALKTIKASIDSGDFAKASVQANDLVKQDGQNYNAFMFLGFAEEKLKHLDNAEKALQKAVELKPQDVQPYKGLIRLYEQQGSDKVDSYHAAAAGLASIYAQQDDREQCQNVINQYETFAKKNGSPSQYRNALELMLPSSSLYGVLEGRVPHPSHLYQRILESIQAEENRWMDTQIAERRTRLGARLDRVTAEVRNEAIEKFQVESCYQNLIDWTQDDDVRHALDQELLQRMLDNLLIMPENRKPPQRDRVLEKANGMVVIKQPFALAWDIALEWVDSENLIDWEPNILHQYIEFFPEAGLARVLKGFLYGNTSPHPLPKSANPDEPIEKLSETDQLIIMSEGLEECKDSMLAHRIMAHTYLALDEHERAAEMARKSVSLYRKAEINYAMPLQDSLDAVNLTLGRSLVVSQSPRHHPEARAIFENILSRKPQATDALIGIGLIYEEDEDYPEAVKFLARALERDADNLRIRLEYAWCRALDGDLQGGLNELDDILHQLNEDKEADSSMKSEALYRIAYCKWHIDPSPKARKDKSGSYRYLIDALKVNPSYPPAYTLLGFYFQHYTKNKARARVAFQKAFELSTSELAAAEQLAQNFAVDQEWDLVELVAQRVVESGKARPAPGSKKKAYSWPFAALGMVQMDRAQYSSSIVSFQHALRISPDNYHCWVGLGESYHNSGRYIAASRAFYKAESIDHQLLQDETWFARYMLANVQRELGAYEDAVEAYEGVLSIRPGEPGLLMSLLQTLVEFGWARVHQGHFGHAAELAAKAIDTAKAIAETKTDIFNLWKAVGDACSVLDAVKVHAQRATIDVVSTLLQVSASEEAFGLLQDVDGITKEDLSSTEENHIPLKRQFVRAAILAYKRAVALSSSDVHAQAVSYYNLGWAEYNAYLAEVSTTSTKPKHHRHLLKAAIRCFKTAIELEASNSEFWDALGVAAMNLSPKVSQHSFIRSLHLNDRSARAWTNLGSLYLLNSEHELANQAFTRAQSIDPEYAAAWVGQGLIAMLYGRVKEATSLFVHAFEIADSSSLPAKRYYALSAFDHLLRDPNASGQLTSLLQPLFALRQLQAQSPTDQVTMHLLSLFAERAGEHMTAEKNLDAVCKTAEARYEESESNDSLAKFAQAKADLSRQLLAQSKHEEAIESAQFVLDISEDDVPGYDEQRKRWRLSAQLTLGLASSFLKQMSQAIEHLGAAAETSKSLGNDGEVDPNVTLLLAQILWATAGTKECEVARTQLYKCIEAHPSHADAVVLLATISLLDDDTEGLEVAEDDLKSLRANSQVAVPDKLKIAKVLTAILRHKAATGASAEKTRSDVLGGIMLFPDQPQGWLELAQLVGDVDGYPFAAEMAVKTALKQVPPGGQLGAEELAKTYSITGQRQNHAQASMLAPWLRD
ncbi:Superkiller protein 3 [Lithohypha guttulata]|uniref:Superkiller protein 3 n=1 Tax=Lithohypha guttulata TaxID=1690604 RepID=UPI00315C5D99